MKLRTITTLILLACAALTKAAVVDTVNVHSNAMNRDIKAVVISPDKKSGNLPVVYLLHGHGDTYKGWISHKPELKDIVDREQIIIVCPDGQNSWYWDSPVKPEMKFETFISDELINFVDSNYPTIKDRKGRAITGLSMGGHGAMWISLRHKDKFGAASSMSGGVDIRPFPNNWGMANLLGPECDNQEIWEQHSAINQIDRLKNGELAIMIDCGKDDFFFEINQDFHNKLDKYKITHDYIVRPGVHNWDYWVNCSDYHIMFFKKYFDKNK